MEAFFIVLLVLGSIVGMTFIVERGLALRWAKVIPPELEQAVHAYRDESDINKLERACERHPSTLGRLLLSAIEHRGWPRDENEAALQTRARKEVAQLERGLVVMEIIVGVAPLLGLVGTIYGLIILFGGMSQSAFGDNSAVAKGIAIALNATFLGLLTAIPSLIAWCYYNKKVETLAIEMESICGEFLKRHYRTEKLAAEAVGR